MKDLSKKSNVLIVPAGEFKAKCLGLIDEMNEKNLTFIVTKRGKPVMQATPAPKAKKPASFIGATTGSATVRGDIVKALPNEWKSAEEKER